MPHFDVITFDCYGTLIDWESGITAAFQRAAKEERVELGRHDILREYGVAERAVEQHYRPYREVLAEAAMQVAQALGWRLSGERAAFLAASLPSWMPFADTNPALEAMREAGLTLGILSNVDDDLLAATLRHFTVPFDLIITAQQVQSYKPRYAHFETARRAIGDARWLHAAESNFHDIVPTNALGIANAWVNRTAAPELPGGTPSFGEYADLAALATAIV